MGVNLFQAKTGEPSSLTHIDSHEARSKYRGSGAGDKQKARM